MKKFTKTLILILISFFIVLFCLFAYVYHVSNPQVALDRISIQSNGVRVKTNGRYAFCMTNGVLDKIGDYGRIFGYKLNR